MFVYRFLNIYGDVLYVGRTNNFLRRIRNEHFSTRGHLPEECYRETEWVEYAEVGSANEAKVYELYYIEVDRPQYNSIDLGGGSLNFPLPELDWVRYEPEKKVSTRGITKKELEAILRNFGKEVDDEIVLMNKFIRGKDNVSWLSKLEPDEQNEYVRMIYMLERFLNGLGEITDGHVGKLKQ